MDIYVFYLFWQRDFVIIVVKFIFDLWKFLLEKKRGSLESLEVQMVEYLKEQVVLKFNLVDIFFIYLKNCFIFFFFNVDIIQFF